MKTLKKLIFSVLFLLPLLTACDEREYDIPNLPEPKSEWAQTKKDLIVPIKDLLTEFKGKALALVEKEIYIKAIITANDISGNVYKQIQVQDATGGINIQIDDSGLNGSLPVGQELVIKCQGLYYGEYNSLPQLGINNAGVIGRLSLKKFEQQYQKEGFPNISRITVPVVNLNDLSVDSDLLGQLITVKDVSFVLGGTVPFASPDKSENRALTSAGSSKSLVSRMSNYATFAANLLPAGVGNITGIFTRFGTDMQILIRDKDDCDFQGSVTPSLPGDNVILNETFGTTAVQNGSQWPLVAEYTGYSKIGAGAAKVSYTAEGGAVSARTNQASKDYEGASGSVNAMMAAAGASLLVNDIATCGATTLNLSFGSNQTSDTLSVAYKINGTSTWVPISYTKTTDKWGLVENLTIALPAKTNTIKLKFTAVKNTFGVRVDDITITTEDVMGAPVVDPDEGTTTPPDEKTSFSEDFENGDSPRTSYTTAEVKYASGAWEVAGVTAKDENDHINGNAGVRFRGRNTDPVDNHYVATKFVLTSGIGTVTFKYSSYSSHSGGQLQLQYSESETGDDWINAGDVVTAPAWGGTMSEASIPINNPNAKRIKIKKIPAATGTSVNIDDVDVTANP